MVSSHLLPHAGRQTRARRLQQKVEVRGGPGSLRPPKGGAPGWPLLGTRRGLAWVLAPVWVGEPVWNAAGHSPGWSVTEQAAEAGGARRTLGGGIQGGFKDWEAPSSFY